MEEAHSCVLQYLTIIESLIKKHMALLRAKYPGRSEQWIVREQKRLFGNRESLTSLQQWLLLSTWTRYQFDFVDFMLCEIEDVIADAISVGRQ